MIRLMFSMLVTCVLLLFAGVWYARERTPESLASALAPVVERTRELAKALPKLLLEPQPAAPAPAPPVERTLQEMTPEEIDEAIEEAVEEQIASLREQAFVEAPLEAAADAPDAEVADAEASDPARAADQEPRNPEAWAALIRRMLVVYRQVGER